MISLKPFTWPIAIWLLATRRYRAVAFGLVAGLALNAASWAALGFGQIRSYRSLVPAVNSVMDRRGYSVTALVMSLGGGREVAYLVMGLLAATTCGICVAAGRRGEHASAFTLSIAACLLATPVLWDHYFALLLVPLALYRPSLDLLWLLPLVLWICPGVQHPESWQMVLALLTSAAVFGRLVPHPTSLASPRLGLAGAVRREPVVAGSR
jgi:alpha-1,2-mannosyltransferase